MMVRIGQGKLQRLGSSLYINVPYVYAIDKNLAKGDKLEIFEDEEGMLILKKAEKRVVIHD